MIILDAGALFVPLDFDDGLTVEEALEETKNRPSKQRIDNLISSGKLSIAEPSDEPIETVRQKAKETGDNLSETDIKLLALALEKNCPIYTDDYSLQNVAKSLSVEFVPVEQKGISKQLKWKKYCFTCKKFADSETCPICGQQTRRKSL